VIAWKKYQMILGEEMMKKEQELKSLANNSTFLGEGSNGRVFLMPDGMVLKLCKTSENCIDEANILKKVKGSEHFPVLKESGNNYMIRSYVSGKCLSEYIIEKGLSQRLAVNLINLIDDFKKLNFTRLDMRCQHIFVQKNESVQVIDPRGHYRKKVNYPRHMLTGIKKLGALDEFLYVLKKKRPRLYKQWKKYIEK
jgi:predicted Ser/Thr protein kinase